MYIAIKRLDSKKASNSNDIPLKIIKEVSDNFGGFLAKNFSECLDKDFFPNQLKYTEVVSVYKKRIKWIRITTDLSVSCLIYQKYMEDVSINKSMNISNHFYQSSNGVSDKDSVHNTAIQ